MAGSHGCSPGLEHFHGTWSRLSTAMRLGGGYSRALGHPDGWVGRVSATLAPTPIHPPCAPLHGSPNRPVGWGAVRGPCSPGGEGTLPPCRRATLGIRGSPLFMGRLRPEAMLAPKRFGVFSGAYMGLTVHLANPHMGASAASPHAWADRPVTQSIAIPTLVRYSQCHPQARVALGPLGLLRGGTDGLIRSPLPGACKL